MKIQGRFIAILAVLGLLIALLPLAPAGAVTGVVTLKGGAEGKGLFFSDQTSYNVLTIGVEDADLTPLRIGTARTADGASSESVNLSTYVVSGEKDKTDRFDGGTTNGPCNEAGAAALDLNGDGDFTDPGEYTAGDINGNGTVDEENIVHEIARTRVMRFIPQEQIPPLVPLMTRIPSR